MPECSWRRGFPARRVPAETAYAELERLRVDSGGSLRPRDVVESARPESAALHPLFEWDDVKAAEAHRLARARGVLRALVIVHDVAPASTPLPAYIRVRIAETPGKPAQSRYQPVEMAMRHAVHRESIILRALQELLAWQARYRDLRELAGLFEAIEDARGDLQPPVS